MPFVAPEDVGTTPRRSLSGRRRLQVWERTGGVCVICGRRIDGVRERWIVEHIRSLELGGADAIDNMGPTHEACARDKTQDDNAWTARAKRQKIRHLGAAVVVRPMPGSRASFLKRKVNGSVVPRIRCVDRTADAALATEVDETTPFQPMILAVDAFAEPASRLCLHHAVYAKENGSRTKEATVKLSPSMPK